MLRDGPINGAIGSRISVVSDVPLQDFSSGQVSGGESWHCAPLNHQPGIRYRNFVSRRISCDAYSPLNNNFSSGLQKSVSPTMSGNSAPLSVYKRKKHQKSSGATNQAEVNIKMRDGFNSSGGSDIHSKCIKERVASAEPETGDIGSSLKMPNKCSLDRFVFSCISSDEFVPHKDPCFEEPVRTDKRTDLDGCEVDDSCSSSKLLAGAVTNSLKTGVGGCGQCSSSGVLKSEQLQNSMSGRDVCIALLRSKGLLRETPSVHHLSSADNIDDICCLQKCKVCSNSETSLNMRICDACEDAFHVKCCNPRVKKLPTGEWFCNSCLKMKHVVLKEKSKHGSKNGRPGKFGPILSMLNDCAPAKFTVRIGDEFQAEVPDWPPSTTDEDDPLGEPEEMDWSEHLNLKKSSQVDQFLAIGNWLQCQEVIEGTGGSADGEVCGKWRRAPLFELQTDDFDCFHTILWDPAHADCAVPQEQPTEEVLRQLKYIEMMRARMRAKKRKLERAKAGASQRRKK